MNTQRIYQLVNDLFYDVVETDEVREQKEELRTHLTERVSEYMEKGQSFDDALAAAKDGLGDPEELISGFERRRAVEVEAFDDDYGVKVHIRLKRIFLRLTPLAPFIFVALGLTQQHWRPEWMTNWWAWGWVIIPIFPILSSGLRWGTLAAIAPFLYVLGGFLFGWWAWGWIIIPVSGILFSGGGHKKRRKKKKVRAYVVGGDLTDDRNN